MIIDCYTYIHRYKVTFKEFKKNFWREKLKKLKNDPTMAKHFLRLKDKKSDGHCNSETIIDLFTSNFAQTFLRYLPTDETMLSFSLIDDCLEKLIN